MLLDEGVEELAGRFLAFFIKVTDGFELEQQVVSRSSFIFVK